MPIANEGQINLDRRDKESQYQGEQSDLGNHSVSIRSLTVWSGTRRTRG